jgi:hypothetical protein
VFGGTCLQPPVNTAGVRINPEGFGIESRISKNNGERKILRITEEAQN